MLPFLLNLTKHFYEVAFFVCALMLCAALLSPLRTSRGVDPNRATKAYGMWMIALSFFCIITVYHKITRQFIAGYQGPSLPVLAEREAVGQGIRNSLMGLSISDHEPLIVDDMTYEGVKHHPAVIPVTYLMMAEEKMIKMTLDQYHVRYGVLQCPLLQDTLQKIMDIELLAKVPYRQKPYQERPAEASICVFKIRYPS